MKNYLFWILLLSLPLWAQTKDGPAPPTKTPDLTRWVSDTSQPYGQIDWYIVCNVNNTRIAKISAPVPDKGWAIFKGPGGMALAYDKHRNSAMSKAESVADPCPARP